MNNERLTELALDLAAGDLSSTDEQEFFSLLGQANAGEKQPLARIFDAAAMATMGAPVELPPASLKERVLGSVLGQATKTPARHPALHFVDGSDDTGWQALPVKGAFVKPLSLDPAKGYAVVLGKLEPGTRYPAHHHTGPEEVYIISGDLTIGTKKMTAGDFHHADAGTDHDVNYSDGGCTILAVLTITDLQAQYAAAAEITQS